MNMNWYILKVAKGQDLKVKKMIEMKLDRENCSQYVGNIIVPQEKIMKLQKGKKVVKDRMLLSGYVLVEADFSYEIVIEYILEVKGVLGFMGKEKNKPDRIPRHEAERMIGKSEEDVVESWMSGETIKIIAGPFSSFTATVTDVNESKKKLNAEVSIFGRPTDVELDFASIEKSS
jgi:transcriptional antiterminator NusG